MMKKITLIYLGRKGGAVPYSFEMTKSLLKNEVQSLEIKDIRKKFVLEQLEMYYG